MIDSQRRPLMDAAFWRQRRHHIVPFVKKLSFVRDVDVYLPILVVDLGDDVRMGTVVSTGLLLIRQCR